MTSILGISAFYHDSAAALVVDGEIVAAAQEERFSREKHDSRFPQQAVDYCLQEAGLSAGDLDFVGFYEKPLLRFERMLQTYLSWAPAGYLSFRQALPLWLKEKLHVPRELRRGLRGEYKRRFVFTEHHESHAASAFFPSPFDEAAILTVDGVGEWSTTTFGTGRGNSFELTHEIRFPHSLGLLYSAFTYYIGFRVNSGEYKLMGLAPYGEPTYRDKILKYLIDVKSDGSFRMNMRYFDYCHGLTMTSTAFHRLFEGPPRQPESPITQREMDLAASVQAVTEEVLLRMARYLRQTTQQRNLVLAGGVALNCVANGRIQRECDFDDIWIQPAAGDAGGALGTALHIWHQLLKEPRTANSTDSQRGSRLGPEFDEVQIQEILEQLGTVYSTYDTNDQLCAKVAELIAEQQVVGWFQGRMEFGPRALGARSILGDARSPRMQSVMNQKIKFRESFRPFAPIVLQSHVGDYFDMESDRASPYMLIVADVADSQRCDTGDTGQRHGLDRVHESRSTIPAVTHVDNSARIQTVDSQRNALLHQLLTAFHLRTGSPVMINTSFNVRSEPIVCSPRDAVRCFMMTDMDVLVVGRHVLLKSKQTRQVTARDRDSWLKQFQLD